MLEFSRSNAMLLAVAGLALSGCVAAVPIQPSLTVIPGEGKTEANLRADDAACRATRATGATAAATVPATADQYYACMASRGEAVVQEQAQAYPGYAPYAYPAYAYAYPYPYGGYPPYGYGYPYFGGYYGPYVGFGVGFGYGGFYGRGFHGGYGGGFRGGYGGGFRGGYGGGFHGGGGFRR